MSTQGLGINGIPLRSSPLDLEGAVAAAQGEKVSQADGEESDGEDIIAEHEQLMKGGNYRNGLHAEKRGRADDDDAQSAADMVRKVVPETDNPSLPTLTFRVLILGLAFCVLGSSNSQLMFFKSNPVAFSSYFVILVTLPLGKLMAYYLPVDTFTIRGFRFTLNPGPFNAKEHMLIAIIARSGSVAAYAGDVIVIQDLFYHTDLGMFGGLLLLLTTQMLGFGLAGLVYNLLVRPTVMVWPAVLVDVTLFNTLHGTEGELTRQRLHFFGIAFGACFLWQIVPSVFAPLLTSFAVLCVIGGGSSVARVLGSGYQGFGILNFSLDWSVVSSGGSLYTPFWASMNYYGGLIFQCWIFAPLCYYGWNLWDSQDFSSATGTGLYDRFFRPFDISKVITPELTLDEAAYRELGPILLTPFFAFTYWNSFATLTAAVTTVALYHTNTIRNAFSARRASDDIHVQILERNYESVPNSWYLTTLLLTFGGTVYACLFYPLQLPIWALLIAIALAIFFLVPCGIITATTNTTIGLNVITELVAGFMLPGRPIGNVVFKALGYMTMSQALGLVGDLKLALYSKIPPKDMFLCQTLGTAVGSIVNYRTLRAVIADKRPYLDGTLEDPTGQWTGRSPRIFYSASVIWGLIGPARFFSGKYSLLYLGFVVGGLLPLIPWYIGRRRPDLRKRYLLDLVSFPLLFNGAQSVPQLPTNVISAGLISAFLSQYWALRKHPRWHQKYNYVLSASLDAATSVEALVIYALGISTLGNHWWNNPVDVEHCKVA